MSRMNYEVGVEGQSAETVARNFLQSEGLLKKKMGFVKFFRILWSCIITTSESNHIFVY